MLHEFKNWFFENDWRDFYRNVFLPTARMLAESSQDLPTDVNEFIETKTGVKHDFNAMIEKIVKSRLRNNPLSIDIDEAIGTIKSNIMWDLHRAGGSLAGSVESLRSQYADNPERFQNAVIGTIGQAASNKLVDLMRSSGGRWVELIWNRVSGGDFSGFPEPEKAKEAYDSLVSGRQKVPYSEKLNFIKSNRHKDVPRETVGFGAVERPGQGSRSVGFEPAYTPDPAATFGMTDHMTELHKKIVDVLRKKLETERKSNMKENLTLAIKMIEDDMIGEDIPSSEVIRKYPGSVLGFEVKENRVRNAIQQIKLATLSVLQSIGDTHKARKYSAQMDSQNKSIQDDDV